ATGSKACTGETTVRSNRSASRPSRALLAAALIAALGLSAAQAQPRAGERPDELRPAPPPPRILEEERARGAAPARETPAGGENARRAAPAAGANDARGAAAAGAAAAGTPADAADALHAAQLAAPRADGPDELDEVIVVGTSPLRLPDLGSRLRAEREAERDDGRIDVTFLPLFDPASPPMSFDDPLFRNRELERVGFIELFRIRFGHRAKK
ncbi:MAG TPA: hypothetical protein VFV10_18345, partial [Gammaproteobacteria bacterium]|nr:hypothetical protein [Gammaproteobacteria bacterium]